MLISYNGMAPETGALCSAAENAAVLGDMSVGVVRSVQEAAKPENARAYGKIRENCRREERS